MAASTSGLNGIGHHKKVGFAHQRELVTARAVGVPFHSSENGSTETVCLATNKTGSRTLSVYQWWH